MHHELCASMHATPHLNTLTSYTHFNANEGYTPERNGCENRHYIMLVPDAYYRRRNDLYAFFYQGTPICSHANHVKVFFCWQGFVSVVQQTDQTMPNLNHIRLQVLLQIASPPSLSLQSDTSSYCIWHAVTHPACSLLSNWHI